MKLIDMLEAVDYELTGSLRSSLDIELEDIVYDSRKANKNTVFVCMVGADTDGHKYIGKAYENGCRTFVINKGSDISTLPKEDADDVILISVDDSRATLAQMSDNFFGHPSKELKLIGITGTKGKTTTTHIIKSILDNIGYPTGLIGTVGAAWKDKHADTVNTTPESYETQKLLRMMADDGVKAVAMEVSSLGVKSHRVDFMQFFCGVFTNISPDHIGGNEHATYEEYYAWKKAFFSMCNTAVACIDDAAATDMLEHVSGEKIFYGFAKDAQFRAENVIPTKYQEFMGVKFDFFEKGNPYGTFEVSLPGEFSVHNALAAMAVSKLLGVTFNEIRPALKKVTVLGRSQTVYMSDEFGIIVDFAHNGVSLKSLIETMRVYNPKRIITLFGSVGDRAQIRREELGSIAGMMSDFTIVTSDDPGFEDPQKIVDEIGSYIEKYNGQFIKIPNREEAVAYAVAMLQPGDLLLLCGKGHEKFMKVCGKKLPFDEIQCVQTALKKRGINSYVHF